MIRQILSLFGAGLALTLATAPAQAERVSDMLEARILPGWRTEDGRHVAALDVTLKDGWKTYWRAPGDAGIPPAFDWSGSNNLSGVEVSWPTPKRILQGGLETIGYAGRMTLPVTLTPARTSDAIALRATIEMGVCKDVCVPVTLKVEQDLPTAGGSRDPRIAAALAERPYSAEEASVTRVACRISPAADGLRLRAEVDLPRTGADEMMVVETDNPDIWVAPAGTRREGNRLITETDLHHVEGQAFAVQRSGLRLTVLGGRYAVDIQGCPAG